MARTIKNQNVISKISTITRKIWEANPEQYNKVRNTTLRQIAESNPKMNVRVIVSEKPF